MANDSSEVRVRKPKKFTDTQRLNWWFSRGVDDSVCPGSVDLWWADEQDGDAVTRVTHGTSVRNALDKAMNGIYESDQESSSSVPHPGDEG